MANILQVQQQDAINRLAALGWSIRRIARELKLHRKTVRAYLSEQNPGSKCTTISTAGSEPKGTISTAGKMGRKSSCAAHAESIDQKAQSGLSAQRIYQDLQQEVGFVGSYEAVKRFVRQLKKRAPQQVWRIEVQPAEEVQVDFGAGAPLITPEGRRRTWIFRVVLSYSRKAYSEAVRRQNTETFLRCLENAFRYFGGVPQTVNLDNLKAAVLKADWADPDLNPKLAEFARFYGTVILPCLPATPRHKGKVERGVGYVKNNALAARSFPSLAAQNTFLLQWESTVADLRIHGTTKQQVAQLFAREKPALRPLPLALFPLFEEAQRQVHRDSYVEVAKSYYGVPPEYIGRPVWVRWDAREVRLFNQRWEQIQLHRRLEPGRFSKVLGIGGGAGRLQSNLDYWLKRAGNLGSACQQWSQGLVQRRGFEAIRSLMGLVSLTNKHSFRLVNDACSRAMARDTWRLRDVRALLQSCEIQTHLAFAAQHPLIRNLSEYGHFIKTQIHEP
ncbi:MAG TPA: IS21 family transposase [Anaerolineales bacterium]|jgi:transposase|nr:IS21 family transposase [Anaerolineales bacterium]